MRRKSNKIPQTTASGATLVASVSFTSILALYNQIFGDENFIFPTLMKILVKVLADRRIFAVLFS